MATNLAKTVQELLDEFDAELAAAIGSFHSWKAVNQLAAMRPELLRTLNANARSWNAIMHSHQVTLFVVLGRIFDTNKGTFNVHKFLDGCKARVGEFSAASFETRRIAGSRGVRPDYLTEFMKNYYAARPKDFEELEEQVAAHAKRFKTVYKPIRDQLMAHRNANAKALSSDLFKATDLSEVEKMLAFLHRVWAVVNELYMNGRKTDLVSHRYRRGETLEGDMESLLQRIKVDPAVSTARPRRP